MRGIKAIRYLLLFIALGLVSMGMICNSNNSPTTPTTPTTRKSANLSFVAEPNFYWNLLIGGLWVKGQVKNYGNGVAYNSRILFKFTNYNTGVQFKQQLIYLNPSTINAGQVVNYDVLIGYGFPSLFKWTAELKWSNAPGRSETRYVGEFIQHLSQP